MAAYCILSLDGGGIRGIFSARLLARLEQAVPGFIQRFDLIAGTSTGSFLALGLADGMSPDDLVRWYRDNAANIFHHSLLDDVKDLWKVIGAEYKNDQLKRVLTQVFHDRTLADLGKHVLVPSFDLDDGQDPNRNPLKPATWKPKFFHNFRGPDSDGRERIVDVALRSSAAPTYFPSYGRFIDGGVIANNPAMAALALALHPVGGRRNLDDVQLLSIGTGINPTSIQGQDHNWGYVEWVRPLIELMTEGGMGVVDFQCAQMLTDCYHRLTMFLSESIPLDDYHKIDRLLQLADQIDIAPTVSWLQEHVMAEPAPASVDR